tara:strand:- start:177 stop:689 length:513 start_codon:yes stop_codon:yes gene_type:complete
MLSLTLTDSQIARAEKRGAALGRLRNSITGGASNVYGMLGEEIVRDFLGDFAVPDDDSVTYNWDIKLQTGETLEVKTKKTQVVPLPHFESSVCTHNDRQLCTAYVFCRVHVDYKNDRRAWILGFLPRQQFFRESRLLQKGTYDPRNRYHVKATCHNVENSQLMSMHQFME